MLIGFSDPENMGIDTTLAMFAHLIPKVWRHFKFRVMTKATLH